MAGNSEQLKAMYINTAETVPGMLKLDGTKQLLSDANIGGEGKRGTWATVGWEGQDIVTVRG